MELSCSMRTAQSRSPGEAPLKKDFVAMSSSDSKMTVLFVSRSAVVDNWLFGIGRARSLFQTVPYLTWSNAPQTSTEIMTMSFPLLCCLLTSVIMTSMAKTVDWPFLKPCWLLCYQLAFSVKNVILCMSNIPSRCRYRIKGIPGGMVLGHSSPSPSLWRVAA